MPQIGTVYLLHFSRPYYHARHYIGFSTNLESRLRDHLGGRGSPLVAAAVKSGIEIFVARTWDNASTTFERRLHRRKHDYTKRSCPICCGPRAYRRWLPRRDSSGVGF
jgi:predicted GIY-YIG superfamily endonuclease